MWGECGENDGDADEVLAGVGCGSATIDMSGVRCDESKSYGN